jgi:hypothetical protein
LSIIINSYLPGDLAYLGTMVLAPGQFHINQQIKATKQLNSIGVPGLFQPRALAEIALHLLHLVLPIKRPTSYSTLATNLKDVWWYSFCS